MPLVLDPSSETKTGESAPPSIRKRRNGKGEKPQKYLYVCGENQTKVEEIESFIVDAIPDIREKVHLLTYTDTEDFWSHAQRTLITNVRSVVGICIGLTPKTVDDYFAEMCRLATELLPKFNKEANPIDLRLALCSLLTFGKSGNEFTLSPKNHTAWDHFLEIRGQHGESAWDIHDRFQKPLIRINEEGWENFIRLMIGMRLDF